MLTERFALCGLDTLGNLITFPHLIHSETYETALVREVPCTICLNSILWHIDLSAGIIYAGFGGIHVIRDANLQFSTEAYCSVGPTIENRIMVHIGIFLA